MRKFGFKFKASAKKAFKKTKKHSHFWGKNLSYLSFGKLRKRYIGWWWNSLLLTFPRRQRGRGATLWRCPQISSGEWLKKSLKVILHSTECPNLNCSVWHHSFEFIFIYVTVEFQIGTTQVWTPCMINRLKWAKMQ